MNWTEVLTIILSNVAILAAFFIHLTNRIDRFKESLESKIDSKIDDVKKEICHLNERMGIVEFQLSQIVPSRTIRFADDRDPDGKKREAN